MSVKPSASITLNKFCRILLVAVFVQSAYALTITVEIGIQPVGTDHPTSFPKLLLIHLSNPGYTSMDLPHMLNTSELVVDGKLVRRKADAYHSRVAGLPPMGEWDGCVSL